MGLFSIKRRIVMAVVTTELILVSCLLLLTVYVVRNNAIRSFDDALHGRALTALALVRYSEGPHPELQFDNTLLPLPLIEGPPDLFRIETEDGRLLGSSVPPPNTATVNGSDISEFTLRGTPYRALHLNGVPVLDTEEDAPNARVTLNIVYAVATSGMNRSLTRVFLSILSGGILLLAVSVYASIRAIKKGLRPLSELASSASAISASDWNFKLSPSAVNVVEIAPLTRAMSEMVQTLHQAFQQQRDFTSNAAHELKTPVAILKSTLQSLLLEPRTSEVYRSGIADALSDLARLEALLHSMLRLARADQRSGNTPAASRIDVIATCEAAIARLSPLAQKRGTTISLIAPKENLPVRAEPEDLEIVWANLIENAIRYGPPDSEIKVTAARRNGLVVVAVEDSGTGIPPTELPKMFDRFHRGDQSRARASGGYGLGLSIAKALVECYGGSISASALLPHGTRVGVELPIASG